jgi:hypothetical protein
METINRPNGPWDLNVDAAAAAIDQRRREGIDNPRVRFRPVPLAGGEARIDEINARITARMMARRAA